MTVEVENAGAEAVPEGRSYIVRHWRGELGLAQSYWVNGVLIGLPFNAYFQILNTTIRIQPFEAPMSAFTWAVLPFLLMQPLCVWQGVGIWRSAGRSIEEGRPGWAWVARVVVIFNLLVLISAAIAMAKTVWSLSVAYVDQQMSSYVATQTGDRVTFAGEIKPDSADRLIELLNKKGVGRLVIRQSVGGYTLPGLRVAELIKDKGLSVAVTNDCASMCTVLLAAGIGRFITPQTIIRLHTGTVVGTNDIDPQWSEVEAWYLRAGMGQDLLAKVRAHRGPYDFYEPTIYELIVNGLATYVFDFSTSTYEPALRWCGANPGECGRTGRQNRAAKRAT